MSGNLVTFDVGAAMRERAAVERDRISAILAAIDELRAADQAVKDDTLSEAGEFLAFERLTQAEEKLLQLVSQPGFQIYQRHLQAILTDVAAGAA